MKRSYDVRTRNRVVSNLRDGFSIPLTVCFPMHDTRATAARTIFCRAQPERSFRSGRKLCVFLRRIAVVCFPIEKGV